MRCVLDVNVLVAALLSPEGTPAKLIRLWLDGAFEVIVSPMLLGELRKVLDYPKILRRVSIDEADAVLSLLVANATHVEDVSGSCVPNLTDADDAYIVGLAREARAILVTGDRQLLDLAGAIPVESPVTFHDRIVQRGV